MISANSILVARWASAFVLAAVVAAPVGAQGRIVVPPSHLGVEGTGSTNVPFGREFSTRVQMAYEGSLFSEAVVVSGLGLRPDGGMPLVGKTVDLEIRLSTMATGVAAIGSTFAINRGPDELVVFTRKYIQLPSVATSGTPGPFDVQIPLDNTFSYDPALGPLLLEVVVHGQAMGAFSLDATYLCTSAFEEFGPAGCGAGGQPLEIAAPTTQVLWGRPVHLEVRQAPPGAMTGLALGTTENGLWNGVPLPLDLTPFGAPQCHISLDLLVILSGVADQYGVTGHALTVPPVPALKNEWLKFQGLAVDPMANALGVVFSRGGRVQVCGWEPTSRVFAPSTTAAWGFKEVGVVPVLELTTQ